MLKLLCKICATLTPSDIDIVEQMSNVATILSNILDMDVFLDCPTKKEDEAMVVFHARPEKNSLYSKDISGEIAYRFNEPAVFRTFETGLPSRNYKAVTQEKANVLQNILPIFNALDEVICVIIIEYSEQQKEFFEKEYNKKAAGILIGQIDSLKDRVTEYINDGIIIFNKNGYATYANKVAKILYEDPDGNFPNHHPDPSEKENLKEIFSLIEKKEFDLGFGFDGDGDRIAVITPKRDIKGDELAYLYALNMKHPKVLGEVKCSQNMYDEIAKIGEVFMGKTGHSNIKKMMKELNVDLAAEVSGHIFFKERYFGFDDALYAMMRVLELVHKGFDLDGELDKMPLVFSTDEIKIKTTDEAKFKIVAKLKECVKNESCDLPKIKNIIDIDGIRIKFENGWALVRASNTTPVIVTRFEAKSKEFLEEIEQKVTNLLKSLM